jgi:uncharacterized protein YdhG (YjbR/CyaY superfamily)
VYSGKFLDATVMEKPETIDAYIDSFPLEIRERMGRLRDAIHRVGPTVNESISYHMPTFKIGGRRLTYFAGWKNHIALYAVPPLALPLESDIAPHRAAKDTLRFRHRDPFPIDLIENVLAALVAVRATSET